MGARRPVRASSRYASSDSTARPLITWVISSRRYVPGEPAVEGCTGNDDLPERLAVRFRDLVRVDERPVALLAAHPPGQLVHVDEFHLTGPGAGHAQVEPLEHRGQCPDVGREQHRGHRLGISEELIAALGEDGAASGSEVGRAVQANDGLARAGGTAHPRRTLVAARRRAPLIGVQENHPVLDGSADHVGQELRLDPGEPGAGPLIVQQPFEFEILGGNHRWSGRRWSLRRWGGIGSTLHVDNARCLRARGLLAAP